MADGHLLCLFPLMVLTLLLGDVCAFDFWGSGNVVKQEGGPPGPVVAAQSIGSRDALVYYIYGPESHLRPKRSINVSFLERMKRQITGEKEKKPEIRTLSVVTKISSRFAQTVIQSEVVNPYEEDRLADFKVRVPEVAFMSNFTMLIGDDLYVSEVKSKEEAKKEFEDAQKENKTAGMVSSDPDYIPPDNLRGMDRFVVSVNIAAGSTVFFTLTYQELLERRNGMYEHRTSIRPDQIVQELLVEVNIYEPQGIHVLDVIEPYQGSNSLVVQDTEIMDTSAFVKEIAYQPSADRQQAMDENKGINGDFVVRYDVNHGEDAGLIETEDNYFVHFFSPSNLEPLPKNIIFVIDISGSMSGEKIRQTREAMLVIVEQLGSEDMFMLLLFDDENEFWPANKQFVKAHGDNIYAAKEFIKERVHDDGGTNIHDALVEACDKLKDFGQFGSGIIVFLTDGRPTAGITSRTEILGNVGEASAGRVSIFSLGFGFDLDFNLLRAISSRNNGFARRIYMGVDADVQLKNFYDEISTPVIYDVKIVYDNKVVDSNSLTKWNFPQYFAGSEIVIAGKVQEDAPRNWNCFVTGIGKTLLNFTKEVDMTTVPVPEEADVAFTPGFLEKLYTYLKVKDLLRQEIMTDNKTEIEEIQAYALQLALEYHLVTPLTSFIIVQEDRNPSLNEERMYDVAAAGYPISSMGASGNAVVFIPAVLTLSLAMILSLLCM